MRVIEENSKQTMDNVLEISDVTNLWIIFSMVSGFILGLSIGYLFFYQIGNLKVNLTTVEEMIVTRVKEKSPFNRGSFV